MSILVSFTCAAGSGPKPAGQSQLIADQPQSDLDVGVALLKNEQWIASIQHLNLAHLQDPTNLLVVDYRGAAWCGLGEWHKAIADFTSVLQGSPTDGRVYLNRGKARLAAGEYDEALVDLNSCLDLGFTNASAFKTRALILSNQRKLPQAIQDWTRGLALEPKDAFALTSRGKDYSDFGNISEALRDYEEAVKLDPTYDRALNNLAWLLATSPDPSMRDGKRAVAVAKEACRLARQKKWDWIETLAAAYAETGEFEGAIRCQKQAIDAAGETNVALGELRMQLQEYERGHPYRMQKSKGKQTSNAEQK